MDEIFNRIMDLAIAGTFVYVIIKLHAIEDFLGRVTFRDEDEEENP